MPVLARSDAPDTAPDHPTWVDAPPPRPPRWPSSGGPRATDLLDRSRNWILFALVALLGLLVLGFLALSLTSSEPETTRLETPSVEIVNRSLQGAADPSAATAGADTAGAADTEPAAPETSAATDPTATTSEEPTASSEITASTAAEAATTAAPPTTPSTTTPTIAQSTTTATPTSSTTTPTSPPTSAAPTTPAPTSAPTTTTTQPPTTASTAPPGGGGGSVEQQILNLVNTERAAAGCGPVTLQGQLTAAALAHSQDMATNGYFSHTGLNGSLPWDRAWAAGYGGRSIGENIAQGYPNAESVMNGWMTSQGHRANILTCSHQHMGLGLSSSGNYWTQLFGSGG